MYGRLAMLRRAFFALAPLATAAACSAGATYVTVPMSQITAPADAGIDDAAEAPVVRVAFRPLPAEPAAPERARGCRREVACRTEEDQAATLAFPPPFEHCPTHVPSNATFSVHETREARKDDPHACCYVAFLLCR